MIAIIVTFAFLTSALLVSGLWQTATERSLRVQGRVDAIAGSSVGPAAGGVYILRSDNYSSLPFLQHLLNGWPRAERIATDLGRAGLQPRVGLYVLCSLGFGLVAALMVLFYLPAGLLRLPLAFAVFFAGAYLPRRYVQRRIRQRRARIEDLLPDALAMVSRALRSGSGFLLALDDMAEQLEGPLVVELKRLQGEISAGLSLEEAFRNLDQRVKSKDLHIAVTAILIQREVGGNLAEVLDNIAGMMRARTTLRGEVRALVARQIFSTYLLAATPPVIVILLVLFLGSLFLPFFEQPVGWIVLAVAGALELVGLVFVQRIARAPIEV